MPRLPRRLLPALLVPLLALVARADLGPRHVRVEGLEDGDVELVITDLAGEPVGLLAGGDVVTRPTGGAQRDDESMLSAQTPSGSAPAAAPEVRPDRLTSTTTATDYFEAFTPAIAPYKRVASYDAVRLDPDGTPVLVVSDTTLAAQPIVGVGARDADLHDAFWGTVMLDFREGRRVPIPSVAPDARILHVRSEPSIDLVVSRDSAGNYFAESLEPSAGSVRLTFLTDAPRRFFGQPAPSARTDALADHVAAVPESVRTRALAFAAELGVGPATPLAQTLDALVAHFRAFVESDTMPSHTDDAYLDLARGGVGVCRHRAYAFTVTALGLGIPAHYVQNEAHAWVEVELPSHGWVRIDLGGSATTVNAHGLQDRPRHEVRAPDPYPQPEVFVRDYLERSVSPLDQPTPTASTTDGSESAADASGGSRPPSADGRPVDGNPAEATASPDESDTEPQPPGADGELRGSSVRLTTESLRVYRGQMLDLAGDVTDADGRPIARARVEVRVGGGRLLGVTLADADGHFALTLGIPPDLGVGAHPLVVEFVGNATHGPSRAP